MNVKHQELVEHLLGCSEEPERIEAWLASAPEAAEALERARREVELLSAAARGGSPDLELVLPQGAGSATPSPGAPRGRRPRWSRPVRRFAAILTLLLAVFPWGEALLRRSDAHQAPGLRLVLTGPAGVPAGSAAEVRVETWDAQGNAVPATVSWAALDSEGAELQGDVIASAGAVTLGLGPALATQAVQVTAEADGQRVTQRLALAADRSTPLAHLVVDRPLARPGEPVRMSARLLDRLTLLPAEGWCTLRVVDPKGAPVETWTRPLEEGVADAELTLADDARGGLWALELRDRDDAFTVARQEFEVRRYQAPQLVKELELARQSYAPGERGLATLEVTRAVGGAAAGAMASFELIVDGASVWWEATVCDGEGRCAVQFQVPREVDRGEARLVGRVSDGGVVETVVRPFVIPTGTYEIAFHPEGGDLVAGAKTRVYFEVFDVLGRPVEASGRVLGADGREAATFKSLHDGRGWFDLEAREGEELVASIDGATSAPVMLPSPTPDAVGLRLVEDSVDLVTADLTLPSPGPWLVGLYCRGTLVAQDALMGSGQQRIELPVREGVGGVLRLTVFDRELKPRAERLLHHDSGRLVRVEIEAREERTLPGVEQSIVVRTSDEAGVPVAANLGVIVRDATLVDLTDSPRLGLADTAGLLADLEVERLEDLDELLIGGPEGAARVDLVLGTRGWRRYGWVDPLALTGTEGDAARRLAVREGHSLAPRVADTSTGLDEAWAVMRVARRAEERAAGLSALAGLLLLALGLWAVLERLRPFSARPGLALASALGGTLGILLWSTQLLGGGAPGIAIDAAMEMADAAFPMDAPDQAAGGELGILHAEEVAAGAFFDDAIDGDLRALGYVDGAWGAENGLDFPVEIAQAAVLPQPAAIEDPAAEPLEEAEEDLRGMVGGADGFFLAPAAERIEGSRRPRRRWARVYSHRNPGAGQRLRSDFTETLYWNPLLRTSASGEARFSFETSDRATTWEVAVDAQGLGRVGQERTTFESAPPLSLEAKLPVELTEGDAVDLVVALRSDDPDLTEAMLVSNASGLVRLADAKEDSSSAPLTNGRGRAIVSVVAEAGEGEGELRMAAKAGAWTDGVRQVIRVVPRGFPHEVHEGGVVREGAEFRVAIPAQFVAGSLSAELVLYPSPLTDLLQGLEGILQLPHGCFEQASATHYPNVLAMAYLRASGTEEPAVVAKAEPLLASGLDRLVGYECSEQGFEWFGGSPAHEALTAYGLLEFHDTAQVHEVDPELLERTRAWLFSRRNGEGGFERNPRALDRFGAATEEVTNAFVTYALACCGTPASDLEGELDRLEGLGLQGQDPYVVALAAGALQASGRLEAADACRDRLKAMQDEDGSLVGTQGSITSSQGDDLRVETTALAVAAWLDDSEDEVYARRGVEALLSSRQGSGRFGSTQATIQALRTLVRYAEVHRRIAHDGVLEVYVDDRLVRTVAFEAGRVDPLRLDDLATELNPGEHRIRLALSEGNEFPFAGTSA